MPPTAQSILHDLFALFPPNDYLRSFDYLTAEYVPEPYHHLLVHEHHMTVTVEAHHGRLVDVRVLEVKQQGDDYARKILLALQGDGRVVQFGLMRIRLNYCSAEVRAAIEARQKPLGRILIEHNVLRRIEPIAFLHVVPGPAMMGWFGLAAAMSTYGRLAVIHCDGQPAVELLEIVAPEEAGASETRP